jgi:alginate O-acetyltransferase complex protein AlgI
VLFNSHEFLLLFLPCAFVLYYLLNRFRLNTVSTVWLVACSFFFYGWWDPRHVPLLAASILVNFAIGRVLAGSDPGSQRVRKVLLLVGLAGNILFLGYYKYCDFFITNVNTLFHTGLSLQRVFQPLAISFFTFTQIAYLVDMYRKPVKDHNLLDYSFLVTFFPKLLQGPIVRFQELMPQIKELRNRVIDYRNVSAGLYLFSIGLVKKVLIADRFGEWATEGFDKIGAITVLPAWAASLSYTFQIYFDFSGYTDMAIAAGLLFNFRLPINFNSPYKALDIQDFWRRWHMTLTRFLRDYIYIPLGGNRVREGHIYANLMATFLIAGLWHGAGWTFVFWGFLHGMGLVLHRAWAKTGKTLPRVLAWVVTFNFVNIAWVFFRARTWGDAKRVLSGMFGLQGLDLPAGWSGALGGLSSVGVRFVPWKELMGGARDAYLFVLGGLILCLVFQNSNEMVERFRPNWKSLLVIAMGAYAVLNMVKMKQFIYFNF